MEWGLGLEQVCYGILKVGHVEAALFTPFSSLPCIQSRVLDFELLLLLLPLRSASVCSAFSMSNNKDNFNVSDLGSGILILPLLFVDWVPLFLIISIVFRQLISRVLVFNFEALNEEDRAGLVNALKVLPIVFPILFFGQTVVGWYWNQEYTLPLSLVVLSSSSVLTFFLRVCLISVFFWFPKFCLSDLIGAVCVLV